MSAVVCESQLRTLCMAEPKLKVQLQVEGAKGSHGLPVCMTK